MSRYRATMRELLEQVRQEGRMKDIYNMAFDGDSAESIAKKLKLDVKTIKKVLGERFTKADFDDNEDNNEHSLNAFELAKLFGTSQEKAQMKAIMHRNKKQGYTSSSDSRIVTSIQSKYYKRLREETELKEFNPDFGKDTKAGRTKETHADDKKTKDEDRIKSLENEIQRLKLELENEKNATVKPEPNPDTGEVPLTVGVAHKYLKDKQEKEKVKKEQLEELEESLLGAMYTKLVKSVQRMSKDQFVKKYVGTRITPGADMMKKNDLEDIWNTWNKKEEIEEKDEFHLFDNKKDAEKKAKEIGGKVIDGTAYRAGHYAVYKGKPVKEELELNERAYRIKFDNVDGAIGHREVDAIQKQITKSGVRGRVDFTSNDKETLYFNTDVEKPEMKRLLRKLGYDLQEDNTTEAVLAGKDYEYDGKGPVKISKKNYAKVINTKGFVKGKPYMMVQNPKTMAAELVPVKFTEERTYTVLHLKHGKEIIKTSKGTYDAAKKYAQMKGLKSTAGVTAKLMTEEVELTEYFATVHSDKKPIADFIKKNKSGIDYVDDDAGGNIEFEGKSAHALADKVKAKFGVRVTKESFEPIGEELEEDTNKYITEKIKGLENKAKKTGMPYSILKKVYDRGMAAWKGGHRPGATQQQWAFARVNSFVTKSSGTWGKADKDLAQKVRAAESVEIEEGTFQFKLKPEFRNPTTKDIKDIALDFKDFTGTMPQIKAIGNDRIQIKAPGNMTQVSTAVSHLIESEEVDENFSPAMITQLKKAYGPLKGKKIVPGPLMKIFDKIDKNKNALIQLYKADIPFVSQMAVSRLISKHNMKGAEINKLREELNELQNYSRQLKDPSKEMMVVDKSGKVSVIDKSEFEKYRRQGYMAAEDTENEACWDSHKQVGFKMKGGKRVPNCVPKNEELEESTKVEGGPPTDGGPGSGAHNHDNKPSSRFDKVSNVKSFGKNLKGVTGVRQNGSRLEFDSNDGTATAREILQKFGKGKVKVTSIPDDDDPEMKSTVVVTPVKEEVQEANLTDKQVDMVKKVADKLPKKDFKKRYGKDADNVKFGTATNIVKKKLNIDGYEGARNLVDRLLKQERGDE